MINENTMQNINKSILGFKDLLQNNIIDYATFNKEIRKINNQYGLSFTEVDLYNRNTLESYKHIKAFTLGDNNQNIYNIKINLIYIY